MSAARGAILSSASSRTAWRSIRCSSVSWYCSKSGLPMTEIVGRPTSHRPCHTGPGVLRLPGMKIFLAGGTGAIGRRLIPQLLDAGHEVAATTRSSVKEPALRDLGAAPVLMDGLDAASVGTAVASVAPDVIIHQMTAIDGVPDLRHFDRAFAATNRLRTEGTDHLLAAARASGVRRVVLQSYTGWPNAHTDGPI